MSYIIGAVTLPQEPQDVIPKYQKLGKEIPMYITKPMVLNMGAKAPTLTVRGFMLGDDYDHIYASWAQTLRDYAIGPAAFPAILLDESPSTDWNAFTSGGGAYGISLVDDSTYYKVGSESARLSIGAGAADIVGLRRTFSTARKFANNDFVSWHWDGTTGSGEVIIKFYDSSFNMKQYAYNDPGGTWTRYVIRLDEFTSASGTMDWDDVKIVEVTFNPASQNNVRIDRLVVGTGVLVDFPGTYDDGIYYVMGFQPQRRSRRGPAIIDYTLELMEFDEFYGEA